MMYVCSSSSAKSTQTDLTNMYLGSVYAQDIGFLNPTPIILA